MEKETTLTELETLSQLVLPSNNDQLVSYQANGLVHIAIMVFMQCA